MNDPAKWKEINDRHVAAFVAWVRLRLEKIAPPLKTKEPRKKGCSWFRRSAIKAAFTESDSDRKPKDKEIAQAYKEMVELEENDPPPALILLKKLLGLSTFDRHVLSLCAAQALNRRIAPLCARVQDDPGKPYPTFALAFALFDDPDWKALSPHGPLRYWRLLEINQVGVQPLTAAALCADERIVNYLKGLNYLDDRLTSLVDPLRGPFVNGRLPPSQQRTVDEIVRRLMDANGIERPSAVELLGPDSASKRMVAGHIAFSLGLSLQIMDLKTLPNQAGDFETFTRLWQRESLLMPLALYIDVNGAADADRTHLGRFLEQCCGVVFIDQEDQGTDSGRRRISFAIHKPSPEEQEQLWIETLQGRADNAHVRLAEQFSFSQDEIHRIAGPVLSENSEDKKSLDEALWEACRKAARVGMGQLAQRIDAKAAWQRLVLPTEQKDLLRQITDQVFQRNKVYEQWGFRETMNRGLGVNALFAGESGAGKTMAAEVIANELKLDLFRIDLSAVVNKYIGETEKNLRKLFDAAEESGAILFFDEADALFGKRSEVKDSHDRYANIEINYLLQRMEAYRGLAILATNMKSALDKAFMRRLRFIVEFPFPDAEARQEIWEHVFPEQTEGRETLDYKYLAKYPLTGGSIHNIALNAAFLAAQAGSPVTMPFVLKAARTEFNKLEKPMRETDFHWPPMVKGVKREIKVVK